MNVESIPTRSSDAIDSRRVLIADDQPDIVAALRLLLRGAGIETDTACSVQEVRDRLSLKTLRPAADGSQLRARHDVGS